MNTKWHYKRKKIKHNLKIKSFFYSFSFFTSGWGCGKGQGRGVIIIRASDRSVHSRLLLFVALQRPRLELWDSTARTEPILQRQTCLGGSLRAADLKKNSIWGGDWGSVFLFCQVLCQQVELPGPFDPLWHTIGWDQQPTHAGEKLQVRLFLLTCSVEGAS